MRYACLIYYHPKTLFGGDPDANQALSECQHHDEVLRESGHFVAAEALVFPEEAITVRVRDGKVSTIDGPFMETKEVLGGIVVIDASDMNEAVRVASGHPLARIGSVEVRPVVDFSQPRPEL
ncbi:YciI family protein [Sphingomonas alpina]|uniref:YciI family protein n=1 Tax=Sphingomonas alpina TaxID=653931 RepID=A0A7H0LLF5_9SPHN|nr:YciI family protein [Sphingomonas alpina]QNQ10508.1 YciI family protein [Sphingomonas alpina]